MPTGEKEKAMKMNIVDMQWFIINHAMMELQKRFQSYPNANPQEGVIYLTTNDIKYDDGLVPTIWKRENK